MEATNKKDYPTPDEEEKILKDLEGSLGLPADRAEASKPLPTADTFAGTDEAVGDIEKDEATPTVETKRVEKQSPTSPKEKRQGLLKRFWHHKKLRNLTLLLILFIILGLAAWPKSRYVALNTAGVRVSATVTVVDEATSRPINNVSVKLSDQQGKTNDDGEVTFHNLRLGDAELVITKRSFGDFSQKVTLGWGSNPFTPFELTATGSEYTFVLIDWLSGKPIEGAEVIEGDSVALSSKSGEARLKIEPGDADSLEITLKAKNYRAEKVTISSDKKEKTQFSMVPGSPHFFVSRRDGSFDIYKIDADGKNEELILKGTGNEREDIVLAPSPDRTYLALVSTRKGIVDGNGYALQSLQLIKLEDKSIQDIVTAPQIRFLGWSGTNAVYVKIAASESGPDVDRQQLMSYDYKAKNGIKLASSNLFNDVVLVRERVYYAPSNLYGDEPGAAFYSIEPEGTDKKQHSAKEVWSLVRTSYDSFNLSASGNRWYKYSIGDEKATDLTTPTAAPRDRRYSNNPDNTHSVWYDYRDGKGVVVLWDINKKTETTIRTEGGLVGPLQWLSNKHLVFRVVTNQQTADYVVSIDGGESKKITDVAISSTETTYSGYYY